MIKKLVRANRLGRMTGIGFYSYDQDGNKVIVSGPVATNELPDK